MPKLLTKKGQDATDENYFIGGTVERLRGIETGERISKSRTKRGERGIWQRRFWVHLIRDEVDYQAHIDYIHWNPVKHGLVRSVADWKYSSFHKFVENGLCPLNWGNQIVCMDRVVGE